MLVSIEINVFCIILFAILFFDLKRKDSTNDQRLFYYYIIDAVIFCLADMLSYILLEKAGSSQATLVFLYITNSIYFISSAFASYLWFLYVLEKLEIGKDSKHLKRRLLAIPLGLFAIVVFLSPLIKFVFYFEEGYNSFIYTRGIGLWLHWVISWGYAVIPTAFAIVSCIKNKYPNRRKRNILLFVVPMLPVIASVFQIFFGYSLIQIGMTISILLIHIKLQDSNVHTDTLTGLYNRSYFNRYLDERLKRVNSNQEVFLMMLDVDNLRNYNDVYGYKSGDEILCGIASTIKKTTSLYDKIIISRFEGDLFSIFGYDFNLQEILELEQKLIEAVDNWNKSNNSSIEITIGFINGPKGHFLSFDQIIDLAHADMQKKKNLKKEETN